MWPVLIVVDLVRTQDPPQMGLVPDERAVQELAPASADPAFGDRVHAGRLDAAEHGPDPASARTASNAAVKFEPRSRIMNLTRCACSPRSISRFRACWAVHDPVGMQSDSENPDAPAGVLDHGQDVCLGAIEKVGCEEVARHDRLGLGAQEQRPRRPAPARRGIDAGIFKISHTVDAETRTPSPASSPWILR